MQPDETQSGDAATALRTKTPKTKRERAVEAKILQEGRCRLCGHTHRPLTRHHLVPVRWQRALNRIGPTQPTITTADNIVPLCEICHKLVETKAKGGGLVHRTRLRASLLPEEIAFVVERAGQAWLDLTYPLAVEGD